MKLRIAWIGKTRSSAIQALTAEYLKRLSRYAACDALELGSEAALLKQGFTTGSSATSSMRGLPSYEQQVARRRRSG